jgi:hypothetical protein
VSFELPGEKSKAGSVIQARAEVRSAIAWIRGSTRLGLKFLDLPASSQSKITEFKKLHDRREINRFSLR